jgi:ribosomal-protein-alanine N-acetyltransferase
MVPADAEDVMRIFGDPEVTRFYDLETFGDIAQAAALIERIQERHELGTAVRWGIARQADDRVIGTCGYHFDQDPHRAEIGYDLAQAFWRQGIMTEALAAMLAHGFEDLGLNRIAALVLPGNVASDRLLRRLGFSEEGTLREYAYFRGRFHDLRCYSLLKREHFLAGRRQPSGSNHGRSST